MRIWYPEVAGLGRFGSCDSRGAFGSTVERVLFSICAALLMAACQPPETPKLPPNAVRTDMNPSAWMAGCFAIDPMTDRLRAAGAREEIELTARPVNVMESRQWYRVEINGSHLSYGVWTPVAASKVSVRVGSNGFGNLSYELSSSNDGLVGTYRQESDVSPGSAPEVPVSLRRVPCVSAPAR